MADELQPASQVPSLQDFITKAKPLNPEATDAQLGEAYYQHFGLSPSQPSPKAELPTLDDFMHKAKPLNPQASEDQLKAAWYDNFGRHGARDKTPTFWEAFKGGMKQGSLGVQESYEGTHERLLDPNDPLKKFTHEAGNALAQEASKYAVPSDITDKSAWERLTNPEFLGNMLGNVLVQSAPSLGGAMVGGVVGGPPGAMAGMAGVTFFQEAGSSYREAYEKYIKAGFSEQKAHENAYQASGIAGAISGLVNSLSVPATLMSPFKGVLKNLFTKYAANVAVDAGDQVTGNIIAKGSYDPSREITAQLPEAVVGSALLGGPETMAGVQAAVKMQRSKPSQGIDPSTPPVGGAPGELRSDPLDHAKPILETKSVDEAIKTADKLTGGIPIDLDALEKEVGGQVDKAIEEAQPGRDDLFKKPVEDVVKPLDEVDQLAKEVKEEVEIEKAAADEEAKRVELDTHTEELRNMFRGDKRIARADAESIRAVDPDSLLPHDSTQPGADRQISRDQYDALSKILAFEDKKIVIYEADMRIKNNRNGSVSIVPPRIPAGFINRSNRLDTIYINKQLHGFEPANVAFHELQHLIQRTDLFDQFRETVLEEMTPNARRVAERRHTKLGGNSNLVFEEILADLHGDAMMRPSFHQKLIAKIEAEHGAKAGERKIKKLLDQIKVMVGRVRELIRGKTALTPDGRNYAELYVKNLERVHDALASALARHYKGKIVEKLVKEEQAERDAKARENAVEDDEMFEITEEYGPKELTGAKEKVEVLETPKAERKYTGKPLYDMTSEELEAAEETERSRNEKDLQDTFGADVAEVKKLIRTFERSNDDATIKNAETRLEEIKKVNNVSDQDADRVLYGVGEKHIPTADDYKDFRQAINEIDTESPQHLGRSLAKAITDVGEKTNPAEMTGQEQRAYAKIKAAFNYATDQGWDLKQISQTAIQTAARRFSDPADAEFMLRRFVKGLKGDEKALDVIAPSQSVNEENTAFMPGPPANPYPVSEPTQIDGLIRKLQDKNIDLKRFVEAIQKAGHVVHDDLNPIFREEMYHKRAEQRATDYTNNELKPLIDFMRSNNLTLEELDKYAHARHVLNDNLNQRLQDMNPDLAGTPEYEKLSGLTDVEARAIVNGPKRRALEAAAKKVDAMVEKTRDMMVEYGLESQARIDDWRDLYKSYVPLHREGFEEEGKTTGTGMSVRGSTAKDRLGSALKVVDVIANVAQARDQVISRGEKMRPVVALAGLLLKYPNKDIAKLDKYAPVTTIDPTTGLEVTIPGDLADYKRPTIRRRVTPTMTDYLTSQGMTLNDLQHMNNADRKKFREAYVKWANANSEVKAFPDPTYKGRDNVVNFRINGKDYAIIFNERNERAMEIAKGLKNLETPQLNTVLKAVAPFTRYLASINTQYNPIFGIVNFVRDAQFAMLTLKSTELDGQQTKIAAGALSALKGIYQDARSVRNGQPATSPTAQLWERFEHVGGPTGYRDLFFTSTERAEELQRLLSPNGWKTIKHPSRWVPAVEKTALFQWLSDYNLAMENAIRLSVFKAGTESGLSDIKAASLAKNITVNFNKKGQLGAQMGSLYAFFNANVQGTARIFETVFEKADNQLGFKFSSVGKQIVFGGILLGALQTFALAMAGFDDDQPPEYVKNRNLVLPAPGTDKGYLMIPMPLGFNLLPTVGRLAAESVHAWLSGRSPKLMEKATSLIGAMANTFSPLGGSATMLQEIAPTALDPVVALKENKDWTGKPIYHEDHSSLRKTPGHTRGKDTATIWAYGLSKMINMASGGTDYVAGKVSPTPDEIDYLINQATGGVGREIGKAAQVVRSQMTGEELPLYKQPLVGRFAGSAAGTTGVRDKFYENLRNVFDASLEMESRAKNKEPFSDFLKEHPEGRLKTQALRFQKQIAELRDQKRKLLDRGDAKAEVARKETQINNMMKMFNDSVERLQKKS